MPLLGRGWQFKLFTLLLARILPIFVLLCSYKPQFSLSLPLETDSDNRLLLIPADGSSGLNVPIDEIINTSDFDKLIDHIIILRVLPHHLSHLPLQLHLLLPRPFFILAGDLQLHLPEHLRQPLQSIQWLHGVQIRIVLVQQLGQLVLPHLFAQMLNHLP
jgi:hypothetical protein